MYSYNQLQRLIGPRIYLRRYSEAEAPEMAKALYSLTSWPVIARGLVSKESVIQYLKDFLPKDQRGESLSLVARLKKTDEVVGFSRYHSATVDFKRIEIGYTWIVDKWQRTFVNTETKFLMLSHAFEVIGVKRVEFSVDPRNTKSGVAVTRIGATFEGTLRKWRFLNDQDPGHRQIYSILDDEWVDRREKLLNMLGGLKPIHT